MRAAFPNLLGQRTRVALDRWLNSPHHRENLLSASWTEQGIALLDAKAFSYGKDAAVWVSEFGQR
jgi:uncharacterized protein YkwD